MRPSASSSSRRKLARGTMKTSRPVERRVPGRGRLACALHQREAEHREGNDDDMTRWRRWQRPIPFGPLKVSTVSGGERHAKSTLCLRSAAVASRRAPCRSVEAAPQGFSGERHDHSVIHATPTGGQMEDRTGISLATQGRIHVGPSRSARELEGCGVSQTSVAIAGSRFRSCPGDAARGGDGMLESSRVTAAADETSRPRWVPWFSTLRNPVFSRSPCRHRHVSAAARVGIGAGWNEPEYRASATLSDIKTRENQLEEYAEALRLLFDDPWPPFGTHYR